MVPSGKSNERLLQDAAALQAKRGIWADVFVPAINVVTQQVAQHLASGAVSEAGADREQSALHGQSIPGDACCGDRPPAAARR